MVLRSRLFSLEELEVDAVHAKEIASNKGSEFDDLYHETKAKVEAANQNDAAETAEDFSSETSKTSVTTSEGDPNAVSETSPEDDAMSSEQATDDETGGDGSDVNASLEAFLSLHRESYQITITQEDIFTKDNLLHAGRVLGGKVGEGLTYLKDIGFQYGPVLLKHVYKGILFALNKTLKALVLGSIAIAKYIKNRLESYKAFKEKITKTRETLALLKGKEFKESDRVYSNRVVIRQLKIDESLDFDANAKVALKFFQHASTGFISNVKANVYGTEHLIDSVVREHAIQPDKLTVEPMTFPGFVKRQIPGYTPDNENLDTFVYQYVLPGDMCFIGYMPKHGITDYKELIEACEASRVFIGINTQTAPSGPSAPYMSLERLEAYLDTLDRICDVGLSIEASYADVLKTRNKIKNSLTRYTKFLLSAQEKISIRDSMAELIAVKVSFIDKTAIAGAMYAHDYLVRVLSSSLEYIKDNIKVQS